MGVITQAGKGRNAIAVVVYHGTQGSHHALKAKPTPRQIQNPKMNFNPVKSDDYKCPKKTGNIMSAVFLFKML